MKPTPITLWGISMWTLATAAWPQSTDTTQPTAGLEEIVVTAQRRSERAQDVPITITSLDAKQLADVAATQISDIQQLTPGLRFDYVGGVGTQVTIRGIGTDLIGPGVGSNVGIYVDGFYQVNLEGADFQLLNIQSIDVLKGPQGTLFGRNTSGGAIQVTTTKPSFTDALITELQYGNYETALGTMYGTAGLSDNVAVDLGLIYSRGDGYFTNIVNEDNHIGEYYKWTVRPGILVNFTPDFSMLLRVEHSYSIDPTVSMYNSPIRNGIPQTVGYFVPGNVTTQDPYDVSFGNYPPVENIAEVTNYRMTLTDTLPFATLTSYTQYHTDFNYDYSSLAATGPYDVAHTLFTSPERLFTQELLLTSTGQGPLNYTAGFFFMDFQQKLNAFEQGGPVLPTTVPSDFSGGSSSEYLSYAGYGNVDYKPLDWLVLTGGLRYTHDVAKNIFNDAVVTGNTPLPNLSSNKVTPRAVIRFTPDRDNDIYLSYAQGYKAQIPDLGDPLANSTAIKPEKIDAYEVGYKYSHQALRFDVSAYDYNWKDIQVSDLVFLNTVPPSTISVTRNAAAAKVYGAEGQIYYAMTSNFEANAGGAYTHARYTDFANAPGYFMCLDFATCGLGFGLQNVINVNARGNTLPRSPDFTGNLGARYTTPAFGGEFALSGNAYFTTKVYFDPANQYWQGSYTTLAMRAQWTDPSKRYTFALFGNNLTDKHYVNQVLESQVGILQGWAAPLTYGISVRVNLH